MSRCFPFPPPGYEKKDRPDDVNILIKEKHRHKKNKDKKDRDRREKSKRKETERSEGKVKEDKDRKRKKHRDKEDKRNSAEEGSVVSLKDLNGEKLDRPSDGVEDFRISVELGRIGNVAAANNYKQMPQKITLINQAKLAGEAEENRGGAANGHCRSVESRVSEITVVGKFFGEIQNEADDGMHNVRNGKEQKDKSSHRNGERKEQKDKNVHQNGGPRGDESKNEKKHKHSKEEKKKRREEKKKRKEEKKKEKVKKQSKEPIKQEDVNFNFKDIHNNKPPVLVKDSHDSQPNLSKRKEPELNSFLHDKAIGGVVMNHKLSSMSRPAASSHQVGQNQSDSGPHKIMNLAVEIGDVVMNHKPNGKFSSTQPVIENPRDVKGRAANNFTAGHGSAAIINRTVNKNVLLPTQCYNNGRNTEPCLGNSNMRSGEKGKILPLSPQRDPLVEYGKILLSNSNQPANGRGICSSTEKNRKDYGFSGVVLVDKKENAEASASSASIITVEKNVKPPHPDLEYLSQILTVPEVEWPEDDDQEWLFRRKEAKRPKLASSVIEQTENVWAQAMRIESADVTALPYVIPF